MKDIFNVGEVFLYKNGTIARIISTCNPDFKPGYKEIKLRCVRPVKGRMSDNVGNPYTYQRWTTSDKIKKDKPIRIGTEEILVSLFEKKANDRSFFKKLLRRE